MFKLTVLQKSNKKAPIVKHIISIVVGVVVIIIIIIMQLFICIPKKKIVVLVVKCYAWFILIFLADYSVLDQIWV